MSRGAVAAALVAWACATASADRGGDAKQLFDEGRALAARGDFVHACERFASSLELDPGALGTELNLADCLQHRGKIARAWRMFDRLARQAAATGDEDRERFARDRADNLVAQLARVVVHVAGARSGDVEVKIAAHAEAPGAEVSDYADPGAIVIEVTAPGMRPVRAERHAGAGDTVELDVRLEELGTERRRSWLKASLVLGLGGGTGVVLAIALKPPPTEGADEPKLRLHFREAMFYGGMASLVVAAYAYLAAPVDPVSASPRVSVTPVVVPGGGGIALGVRF